MVSVQCVTENMANCYHVHIFWRYCYTVTHYTSSQAVHVHPGRIRPPRQYTSTQDVYVLLGCIRPPRTYTSSQAVFVLSSISQPRNSEKSIFPKKLHDFVICMRTFIFPYCLVSIRLRTLEYGEKLWNGQYLVERIVDTGFGSLIT